MRQQFHLQMCEKQQQQFNHTMANISECCLNYVNGQLAVSADVVFIMSCTIW